jgi:hypothetical protein
LADPRGTTVHLRQNTSEGGEDEHAQEKVQRARTVGRLERGDPLLAPESNEKLVLNTGNRGVGRVDGTWRFETIRKPPDRGTQMMTTEYPTPYKKRETWVGKV